MIITSPSDTTVTQRHSATFHCQAYGTPKPRIIWTAGKDGTTPLRMSDRFAILPEGSLVIKRAELSDQGVYHCIASNAAGTDEKSVILTVEGNDIDL